MRTKLIRVSDWELKVIKLARDRLLEKGYDALPEDLRPPPGDLPHLGAVIGIGAELLIRFYRERDHE